MMSETLDDYENDLYHLARLAVARKHGDVNLYVLRMIRRIQKTNPEFANRLLDAIGPLGRGSILRDELVRRYMSF